MKVLVVDDQEFNRKILVGLLESKSFECLEAADGHEAIAAVQTHNDICLILMDVVMPGMDGHQATTQIRALLGDNHIPIIFITASEDNETLEACFSSGGDDFISRPVNPTVLFSRIGAHERVYTLHNRIQENNKELLGYQRDVDREHQVVEHVFNNVIKQAMPQCSSVNAHISPMSMFNGDLYLSYRADSGATYIFLGDFTGHGLSAAIGCMPVGDLFYAMAAKGAPVGHIAAEANKKLLRVLPENMFCCAVIMKLSPAMDLARVWSGGMHDILVVADKGRSVDAIEAQHMPLGILDYDEFDATDQEYTIAPGSRLFFFTDGVIESQNPEGEMFGEDRMLEAVQTDSSSIVDAVVASLEDFNHGIEQQDDISLVEIITKNAPAKRGKSVGNELSGSNNYIPPVVNPKINIQMGVDPLQLQVRFSPSSLTQEAAKSGKSDSLRQLVASHWSGDTDIAERVSAAMSALLNSAILTKGDGEQAACEPCTAFDGEMFIHIEQRHNGAVFVTVNLVEPQANQLDFSGKSELLFSLTEPFQSDVLQQFDSLHRQNNRRTLIGEIYAVENA